jgi:predicted metalloprotease with PDZ domain
MSMKPLSVLVLVAAATSLSIAAEPVRYRLSFPEPEHHWMQVEVTFSELGRAPLELRMSQTSPGRYSVHDFAKNVYDVQAVDGGGRAIALARPDPHGWTAATHDGSVKVRYRVFGDMLDGTYLAIDTTHAHINMPAALMWARGVDDRSAVLTLEPPAGRRWRAATQLFAGASPFEFTAPNLQYLMDSPIELGPAAVRTFAVGGQTIRFNAHHTGAAADLDGLVSDVEKIVREELEIFGELPAYESGHYTFLADYLPWASGDGMEHRNSTVITSAQPLGGDRADFLDTIAHEFFHGWNVERIRPASLEPFDFERANLSGELWLGEGFTQYYAPLVLSRTRLADLDETVSTMAGLFRSVALNPARAVRSAEEMSRMAAFTDGSRAGDRTNWSTTYISYYPFGGAIALALDLTLRDRSNGAVTLDDFMRAMWRAHGKPGGARPGYVDRPYTMADAEARLAEVSKDAAFARSFFARYIQGHEVADYARLLQRAGLVLRKPYPGQAWWGDPAYRTDDGVVRIASTPAIDTPMYSAGLDVDDEIRQVDGSRIGSSAAVAAAIGRRKPGDRVAVVYIDRSGIAKTVQVTLAENPALELLPIERTGGTLTADQRTFRERWLQ